MSLPRPSRRSHHSTLLPRGQEAAVPPRSRPFWRPSVVRSFPSLARPAAVKQATTAGELANAQWVARLQPLGSGGISASLSHPEVALPNYLVTVS